MVSFENAKKGLKSFLLALMVFLFATVTAILFVAFAESVVLQFASRAVDPTSVGAFTCGTVEFVHESGYEYARCDFSELAVYTFGKTLLFGLLALFVLAAPFVAWGDDPTFGAVLVVVLSYAYILGLAMYVSRIFDVKEGKTVEEALIPVTKKAWGTTVILILFLYCFFLLIR